jgi:Zn-dependent protease
LDTLLTILVVAPVLLLSVVAHEIAHGYAALRQGDNTAAELGRLSWNPAKHIDPFMTILLPVMMLVASGGKMALGGAKPVPVNPRNYRNYRRGDIIVSLAGVATNLVLAIIFAAAISLTGMAAKWIPSAVAPLDILQRMVIVGVWLNWLLIAFNLMPIPPLDGSHVVKHLLPAPLAIAYVRLARYGMFVLIAILFFGRGFLEAWLRPAFAAANTMVCWSSSYILAPAIVQCPSG